MKNNEILKELEKCQRVINKCILTLSQGIDESDHVDYKKIKRIDYTKQVKEVLQYFNKVADRNYNLLDINIVAKKLIVQRLSEGNSVETLKKIIALKTKEWKSKVSMNMYLRPATLFNKDKFYTYIDEIGGVRSDSPEIKKILRKLTVEFGRKGIRNKESDKLAKQLIELGYDNKDFLKMYTL